MSERDPRIDEALKRFQLAEELEQENRKKCLDDLEFLMGNQWTAASLRDRALQGRPALVVNRMDQFVQQITNAQRQNRVSARVFPVDDEGDIDTAEVMQGLIRHIEYNSSADLAYDTAAFYAVAMGFGYYRVLTDYCDPASFDQEIKIARIRNPFQVYLGPHDNPDGSDADFGFIITDLTKDEYKRSYPTSELAGIDDWTGAGNNPPGWLEKDGVRIAEYYYREYTKDTLYLLDDGPKLASEFPDGKLPNGVNPRNKRDTQTIQVKWCKITAHEILEETDWADETLPIVKVVGNELDVNGKLELKGIVRNLKDAQRQYNFMLTAQTEAAMDRGHVVVVEGQIEGQEKEWAERKTKNPNVLQVKNVSLNGAPAPLPARLGADPSVPALTEARLMAADDLKALTGIYDAALGNKSNETSGRAITNRQAQSETANYHFQDNLTRSITCSTKKLVNLMPTVYDTARTVRIVGDDDSHKLAKINQDLMDANGQPQVDPSTDKPKRHDFSVGKYDLICTAGPSFATKRQQAAEQLTELVRSFPEVMGVAGDLIMKSYDIPYAQEISERLKKALPANLQDDEDGKQPIPPEVQQKLEQSGQMIEQLTATVHQLQDQIDVKQAELNSKERTSQADMESKERIASLQSQTQITIATLNQQSAQALAALQQEMEHIHKLMDAQNKLTLQGQQLAHQADQADADREHQAAQSDADRQAQAEQQASQQAADAEAQANQPEPAQV